MEGSELSPSKGKVGRKKEEEEEREGSRRVRNWEEREGNKEEKGRELEREVREGDLEGCRGGRG